MKQRKLKKAAVRKRHANHGAALRQPPPPAHARRASQFALAEVYDQQSYADGPVTQTATNPNPSTTPTTERTIGGYLGDSQIPLALTAGTPTGIDAEPANGIFPDFTGDANEP